MSVDQIHTNSNTKLPSVNPMKKQSSNNILENSRTSQGMKDSRVGK